MAGELAGGGGRSNQIAWPETQNSVDYDFDDSIGTLPGYDLQMLVWILACSTYDEASLGAGARCAVVETEVAADDTTLGFSAQDVFDLAEGERAETFTYQDTGVQVGIVFTAERSEDPILLRTWKPPDENPDLACTGGTALAFSMDSTFASDDGAFAESWREDFENFTFNGLASFLLERDVADLTGSYDSEVVTLVSIWNTIDGIESDTVEMHGVLEGVDFAEDGTVASERCIGRWNYSDEAYCDE